MAIISLDMRSGRSEEHKRRFASSILEVVSRATSEPREHIFLVIREHPGINFAVGGRHLPDVAAPTTAP